MKNSARQFIGEGGDRFLRCVGVPINMISDFCRLI